LAIALPIVMSAAQQADRGRTEALARRATERLQTLQHEADELAAQEQTVLGELRKLEVDRQIKIERSHQIEADAAAVAADLAANTLTLERLEREEASIRPELGARLAEIYKLGRARYVRLLLSTADARSLARTSRTVAVVAKLDRDRVAEHQHMLDELRQVRATLEARKGQLAALGAEAERAQADVERAAAARAELIRRIDVKRDLNAQLSGELQTAQQKLQNTLRVLAAGGNVEAPALPFAPFRGALEWPVAGTMRRRFSRPVPGQPATNGIDIAAAEGAPVSAIHDGTVAFAGPFAGFGNLLVLDHGGQTFSLYGDLTGVDVKKGARVQAGEPVGSVGLSPAGPAGLYFELRVDGQPVDPLQWLKRK
jgi:septal ring factor EnvC (AmiA/AmiB activator)